VGKKVLYEQRPIRPSIGIGHAANEAKVVFADIENQALPNFVGIVIRETHISQSRPS
jgi:hypothetical protein